MTCCNIHVGDIGTDITLNIKHCNGTAVDISRATDQRMIFKKPSGASVAKTAYLTTDGVDGKITYIVESGVFDEKGVWKVQASVTAPNGSWKSDIQSFQVDANL